MALTQTHKKILGVTTLGVSLLLAGFIVLSWRAEDAREVRMKPGVLPVRVLVSPAFQRDHGEHVKAAIRLFNEDCVVFALEDDRDAAHIRVSWAHEGFPCGNHANDTQPATAEGSFYRCISGDEVRIQRIVEAKDAARIIAHEIGHSLQLEHDHHGVMSPGAGAFYLTGPDRNSLKEACREGR